MLGLVAAETGYHWAHRLSHEVPLLWRFHAIHHSAEEVYFLVNTRAHPVDMVFGRLGSLAPLYILGLGGPAGASGSLVPVIATLITTTWGFFVHANIRWRFGPLEWLIAMPAFHHWHHTRTGPINHNYASTLPWLDWLFGTAHLPDEWPEDYGIKDTMPLTLLGQLAYPLLPLEAEVPALAVATETESQMAKAEKEPFRNIDEERAVSLISTNQEMSTNRRWRRGRRRKRRRSEYRQLSEMTHDGQLWFASEPRSRISNGRGSQANYGHPARKGQFPVGDIIGIRGCWWIPSVRASWLLKKHSIRKTCWSPFEL